MAKFVRLMPDYWCTIFNFEAIGVVTTVSDNHMKATGHFRSQADYIGIDYYTDDYWMHDYCKYTKNPDYTGTKLSFDAHYSGRVCHFSDVVQQPSIIIKNDDSGHTESYVTLGYRRPNKTGSSTVKFTGTQTLNDQWIVPGSQKLTYINPSDPNTTHDGVFGTDYGMDFVKGLLYTVQGAIEYNADCTITYDYCYGEHYDIDFDNLYQGTHPNNWAKVNTTNIHTITIPAIPDYYTRGEIITTGRSDAFTIDFTNMVVTGGDLNEIPEARPKNPYRLAEGFDDEYNKNPKRICEMMKILGYEGMIDFYIGASHFYDKHSPAGAKVVTSEDMFLDQSKGLNESFKTWFDSYLKHMKLNGFTDIVVSVSMENLQCPVNWRQKMWNGSDASSGWQPPTHFYSPVQEEVRTWVRKITKECLNFVVSNGFKPILQLGESWYWWQEFIPGDVNTPMEGRPPCFYDEATLNKIKEDTGLDLPKWSSSDIEMTEPNKKFARLLRQYLGSYTEFMSSIADEYENSQFTVLFFPPSVIDKQRTPEFISIVNAPFEYWESPKLDFIQIEDYDWVTEENQYHEDVYQTAWEEMNYDFSHQHYFSGFVLLPMNAVKEWALIELAAQKALGKGFAEVFIWAGTQIRRDSWNPKLNEISTDAKDWKKVSMELPEGHIDILEPNEKRLSFYYGDIFR